MKYERGESGSRRRQRRNSPRSTRETPPIRRPTRPKPRPSPTSGRERFSPRPPAKATFLSKSRSCGRCGSPRRLGGGVALRWVRDEEGKVKTQTVEVTYVEDGQRIVKRVDRRYWRSSSPRRSLMSKAAQSPGAASPARSRASPPRWTVCGRSSNRGEAERPTPVCSASSAPARPSRAVSTGCRRRPTKRRSTRRRWNWNGERRKTERSGLRRDGAVVRGSIPGKRVAAVWSPTNRSTWCYQAKACRGRALSFRDWKYGVVGRPLHSQAGPRPGHLARLMREAGNRLAKSGDAGLAEAVMTLSLHMQFGKLADFAQLAMHQCEPGDNVRRSHIRSPSHWHVFGILCEAYQPPMQAAGATWHMSGHRHYWNRRFGL